MEGGRDAHRSCARCLDPVGLRWRVRIVRTELGRSVRFAGTALTPVDNAPALALRNYLGDPVNLEQYRGKAVLVTFLYTHCIDVCP